MPASNPLQAWNDTPPRPDGAEAQPQGPPRPRLLIVDDVADNRIVLGRRFQRRNFEIVEADSGRAALAMIDAGAFDVVLLDISMPDISGLEVLRAIRTKYAPTSLPVIMVTANNLSTDIVGALEAGANDYVAKPVDFAVALARVNSQVQVRRATEALNGAYAALNQANEGLERRVAERTAQLSAINNQLQGEIAHREISEARSQYLAHHDALTGLANRLLFREEVERALEVSKVATHSVAVLFVDLDGFKIVNDSMGHFAGDFLLRALAVRMRDNLPAEVAIARLGGDEFGILLNRCSSLGEATAIANQVIELIGAPVRMESHSLNVSASIGVVYGEDPSETVESLLKCADLAMYRAKAAGGGAAGAGSYRVFDPEMDSAAQNAVRLKNEMRAALHNGDFKLHFQPIVSTDSGLVTGFEALARWPHAQQGMISPGEFIPLAESTGLIVQLGEWALREACHEAKRWPDNLRVAVNLSPVQFGKGDLLQSVVSALAHSGLPAARLELEITEAVLLDKTERNIRILESLRLLGVKISMDDFGTGFSSLSYLRSFPFDKIKIDQSFIRSLSNDGRSQTIVGAITGLGLSFGMATVAEGVATTDQLDCLVLKGCTEVQGELYSMPVPGSAVLALLAEINGGGRR